MITFEECQNFINNLTASSPLSEKERFRRACLVFFLNRLDWDTEFPILLKLIKTYQDDKT